MTCDSCGRLLTPDITWTIGEEKKWHVCTDCWGNGRWSLLR